MAEGQVDEAFEFFLSALESVLRKNRELELLLAKLRRERIGKRSERVDPAQLSLLFEQLCQLDGQQQEELDPEAEAREDSELQQEIDQAVRDPSGQNTKARKRRRNPQVRDVERQVHHIGVPTEERNCSECGGDKQRIGEDITRFAGVCAVALRGARVPSGEVRLPEVQARRDDRSSSGEADRERSAADGSLLAHVVVSKYVDHCPLHRLHRIYARSGATIPVSTLSDWTGEVAERLEPLVEKLAQRAVQAYVVRTDATGLKVLDVQSPENIERGTMWCYVGDDRDVVFRYTPTGEGASGPWEFLAGRTGYVQADAASVLDRLFNGQAASAVELGCWPHGRRRFVALQDTDCRVAYPLKLIGRLYRIERLADARHLSPEERGALRRERSQPVLEKLKRWLVSMLANEPPSSELAKAAGYLLNQWRALSRFLEDGRLSLDNNLCEQQLRDIALGRKNYLFAGSHDAARRAAVLYSLMRTWPSTASRLCLTSPTCSASWPTDGNRAGSTSSCPIAGKPCTATISLAVPNRLDTQRPALPHHPEATALLARGLLLATQPRPVFPTTVEAPLV